MHYVGNAGSAAEANRNYFESLKNGLLNSAGQYTYASSHYIVGLNGEILRCVPENEIAYCSNDRNSDTISIENCHPDAAGKFNDKTAASLVELAADICTRYGLDAKTQVIRHYDITKKLCPLYYVNYPDAWTQFRQKVADAVTAGKKVAQADPLAALPQWQQDVFNASVKEGRLNTPEYWKPKLAQPISTIDALALIRAHMQ